VNTSILLLISFFILLSSLSESFEFLVHNEESLLILCFIAFIFFAYSFLSVGFFDDFQKRVSSLEQQLLVVVATRFKVLLSSFNEFFFRKGLVLRFQFILSLLISGFRLGCSVFSSDVKFLINSLFLFQLGNILRLKNQVLKPIQSRLNHFSLVPVLFGKSSATVFALSFECFIKKSLFSLDSQFFHKSIILKQF
jgi:hypothetical protein